MTNGHAGHQHFNPSGEAARYLVLRYGNPLFGIREGQRHQGKARMESPSIQIEFKDERSEVRALFDEECQKHGVTSNMKDV